MSDMKREGAYGGWDLRTLHFQALKSSPPDKHGKIHPDVGDFSAIPMGPVFYRIAESGRVIELEKLQQLQQSGHIQRIVPEKKKAVTAVAAT